jgi:hypothetical protein
MVVLEAYPCVAESKPRQHCCSSGITECEVSGGSGGLKNTKNIKNTQRTQRFILVQAIGALRLILVFKNIQIKGLQQNVREI